MPARRSIPRAPWWQSSGEDICPHCGGSYVYELEFRCIECDGPGCMNCKELHVEGHHVCTSCAGAARSKPRRTVNPRSHTRGR